MAVLALRFERNPFRLSRTAAHYHGRPWRACSTANSSALNNEFSFGSWNVHHSTLCRLAHLKSGTCTLRTQGE